MDISVVTNSANFSPFFMQYTGNMTYNISGYNFTYENRDNIILPSRGSFFSIGQNFAIAGGSRRYVQNNISAGKYIPMFDTETNVCVCREADGLVTYVDCHNIKLFSSQTTHQIALIYELMRSFNPYLIKNDKFV
jgi:outer membrane protein assembly factor BamA